MSNIQRKTWQISRRHVLRCMGATVALPMLDCMAGSALPTPTKPKRSVFLYIPNGVNTLTWQIQQAGADYALTGPMEALERHRAEITPISGLHHPNAIGKHHNCDKVWLTGADVPRDGGAFRNTVSADQLIAEIQGPQTRFGSLEMAVSGHSLAWSRDGIQLPAERSTKNIFNRLFGVEKDGKDVVRRRLNRRASVLDVVLDDARQISKNIGAEDRTKLDEYLTAVRQVGQIDFGEWARYAITTQTLRWFDFWLKGKDNGIDKNPPFRIFVMGDNRWRNEQEWPPKRAVTKTLFLTSGGKANTPAGDGRLVAENPGQAGKDVYTYDPADPVPTLYGKGAFTVPADQAPLAQRQDILVFQTEPLEERLEVTGNAVVAFYAATTAGDTDFFARLIDVAPNGKAIDVAIGLVRAKYRHGRTEPPDPTVPGEPVRYEIRLRPTSNAFLPGHRIRLDITSSDFPNYNRNHNIAGNPNFDPTFVVAENTIFHGAERPAELRLPVIANEFVQGEQE